MKYTATVARTTEKKLALRKYQIHTVVNLLLLQLGQINIGFNN
jgi:hypothetical protein